jgi:nicotinamidase/pyrazinamidase
LKIDNNSALVVVDVQKDFCPGGALPVKEGDAIVTTLNKYIERFATSRSVIIFTRDWHPPRHISFYSEGGRWPAHCVRGSKGAEFHASLKVPGWAMVVSKAVDEKVEAYSGFQGTGLAKTLRKRRVIRIFVGGLATDYCVKETVLDALSNRFQVYYLTDASKGVNVNQGDSERAILEMKAKGAECIVLSDLNYIARQDLKH